LKEEEIEWALRLIGPYFVLRSELKVAQKFIRSINKKERETKLVSFA
jgi:hypothetical protein